MKTGRTCIVSLSLLASLNAQTVGVSLSALTPLTAKVGDGTNSNTATWPAGLLTSYWGFGANLPGNAAGANVAWVSYAAPTSCAVRLEHVLGTANTLPTLTARTGPHEFLVEFTAAAAVHAFLRIDRYETLSPGTPAATVQLDYDNDGVIDVASVPTLAPIVVPRVLGPQPLLVRVIVDAAANGSGMSLESELYVSLLPDNDLSITRLVATCAPLAPTPPPLVQAEFPGSGIQLSWQQSPLAPSVMVLGLTPQPLLLGSFGGLPCVLLPAPDIVLFEPTGLRSVPLPAAVRPVTFFAQGVTLVSAGGFAVSDGFAITAN